MEIQKPLTIYRLKIEIIRIENLENTDGLDRYLSWGERNIGIIFDILEYGYLEYQVVYKKSSD
jgi:hypothetical protein